VGQLVLFCCCWCGRSYCCWQRSLSPSRWHGCGCRCREWVGNENQKASMWWDMSSFPLHPNTSNGKAIASSLISALYLLDQRLPHATRLLHTPQEARGCCCWHVLLEEDAGLGAWTKSAAAKGCVGKRRQEANQSSTMGSRSSSSTQGGGRGRGVPGTFVCLCLCVRAAW